MAKQSLKDLQEALASAQAAHAAAEEAAKAEGAGEEQAAALVAAAEAVVAAQAAVDKETPAAPAAGNKPAGKPAVAKEAVVPVFTDEDGAAIPLMSTLRLQTTGNFALTSNDGTRITQHGLADLHGPDVREGDWYTSQFKAGLIMVESVKKLKG